MSLWISPTQPETAAAKIHLCNYSVITVSVASPHPRNRKIFRQCVPFFFSLRKADLILFSPLTDGPSHAPVFLTLFFKGVKGNVLSE